MEKSIWIIIRELRRVKDAPNSHSNKNKVIFKKLVKDIAELIAKAHVDINTDRTGEALKKYREFKSISNENRIGKNT